MPSQRNRRGRRGGPGQVRIIAGAWRGRRLPVAEAPGLRPSGDRVRETLFNWLQARLPGARCADPFAGTGVLGFEAASRGAARVSLVERAKPVAGALRDSVTMLDAQQVSVIEGDGVAWLSAQAPASLDLVFIDPPFDSDLAGQALDAIVNSDCLAPGGLVYLESPGSEVPGPPAGFLKIRDKRIGDVRMLLLERSTLI